MVGPQTTTSAAPERPSQGPGKDISRPEMLLLEVSEGHFPAGNVVARGLSRSFPGHKLPSAKQRVFISRAKLTAFGHQAGHIRVPKDLLSTLRGSSGPPKDVVRSLRRTFPAWKCSSFGELGYFRPENRRLRSKIRHGMRKMLNLRTTVAEVGGQGATRGARSGCEPVATSLSR